MQGKFKVKYTGSVVKCAYFKKDKRRQKCSVHKDYKTTLAAYLAENVQINRATLTGYTCCQMSRHGRTETFRGASQFMNGDEWYDWCMVDFEVGRQKKSYPCRILGFVDCDTGVHAVVMSSTTPVSYSDLEKTFVVNLLTNTDDRNNFCVVPVEAITHPLFVYEDYGGHDADDIIDDAEGMNRDSYWCVLPERMWGRHFGDKIKTMSTYK